MLLFGLVLLWLMPFALARVQYLGVAIAGGDFGCQIDGSCPTSSVQFAGDAADQMEHFVSDGVNLIRIPTSWQFLVNNQLGASLNTNNLAKYDQLIQSCLSTGAYCMIDLHNFARWNGGIIGQGGPTDDQFVNLWTQLATKYAAVDKVVFQIMNEPHDLDLDIWAQTCHKVVTAIRNAGATSHMILLPGTNFDSAATLVSSGSAAALMAIKNPDGSTDGLIMDIHKYLDEDNSGTHEECVTDNVDSFTTVADFLRENGRQGLVSESGASSAASCFTAFCAQNTFINQNSDVFLGFVAWAAGSFSTSYVLSLTPSKKNGQYVDSDLMSQCVISPWLNSNTTGIPSAIVSSAIISSAITSSVTASSATTSSASPPSTTSTSNSVTKVGSKTSVYLTATMSTTMTTLLTAPGTPTVLTETGFGRDSIASVTASSTETSRSSTSTSNSVSGSSHIPAVSSLAVGRLFMCGLLVALFL
ncbi:glycoside hydrolase superfamily [Xylariales sp. AK1849]|nr:glycoside hydrolase superfamily [Xylariales sp. AK1849]